MSSSTSPRKHAYGDQRRSWSDAFVSYMDSIVDHPAYSGMPCTRDDDGKIDWTIPSNRSRGSKNWEGNRLRREWWERKAREVGIPIEGHWLSRTAKAIHPFGRKPCQTCGRVMELAYVYPTKATVTALNKHLPADRQIEHATFLSIDEVIEQMREELGSERSILALTQVFPDIGAPQTLESASAAIRTQYVDQESRKFSPGAMSNAPDRLDGFHTYNLCCRSNEDRGRARSNLVTYTVDRRAYEQWSEGDWAVADLVMAQVGAGTCNQCGNEGPLSADHIGPISLGFAHSPHFIPLCRRCNSAKNNRMSLGDVLRLRELERKGLTVASWQIRRLWERTREHVSSDVEALLLSKLLRINQHHYLELLIQVYRSGRPDLMLQFLHPEYAYQRLELVNFDPIHLTFDSVVSENRQDGYARSRATRMMRIAFDSLLQYSEKSHRNIQRVEDSLVHDELERLQSVIAGVSDSTPAWAAHLVADLALDSPAEVRDARLERYIDRSADDHAASLVLDAIDRVLSRYADVLFLRFERGEAVNWDDFDES